MSIIGKYLLLFNLCNRTEMKDKNNSEKIFLISLIVWSIIFILMYGSVIGYIGFT